METKSLTQFNVDKAVVYPIKDDELWRLYKKQFACFWGPEEISFTGDREQLAQLPVSQQKAIKVVLAYLAGSDSGVAENAATRFYGEVDSIAAKCNYGYQIMIENVHAEVYSLFIDTLIPDEKERSELYNAINTYPSVNAKNVWMNKWIHDRNAPLNQRQLAFALVEGVFFQSSFCLFYWYKSKNKLHGLTFANELISRDEGMHTDLGCIQYKRFPTKMSEEKVYSMVKEVVSLENDFVDEWLGDGILGLSAAGMKVYVQLVADNLLMQLGYKPLYKTGNPYPWMDMISLQGKTNFFARRVGEYQKAGVVEAHGEICFDADF